MRHAIEELLCAIYVRLRQEPMGAQVEISKSVHNQFDISEGSLVDSNYCEEENPFHDVGPANCTIQGGLEEQLVQALELNGSEIKNKITDCHRKMQVDEQENDMLDPIYDEYPKKSEEIDVYLVQGESLVVHKVKTTTTLEEGEDWRQVGNLLDISRDTRPSDDSGVAFTRRAIKPLLDVKRTDSVSTTETNFAKGNLSVERKKKKENLKASNSVKVMRSFREKLPTFNVEVELLKVATENQVIVVSGDRLY